MIVKCNCVNEGQDRIHGNQMRVKNPTTKTGANGVVYRCTSCGNDTSPRKRK